MKVNDRHQVVQVVVRGRIERRRSCRHADFQSAGRRIRHLESIACPSCGARRMIESPAQPDPLLRRVRHQCGNLPELRRQAQGDCLHRTSQPHRHDPRARSATRPSRTTTTTASTAIALRAHRRHQPGQAVLKHRKYRLTLAYKCSSSNTPLSAQVQPSQPPHTPSANANGAFQPSFTHNLSTVLHRHLISGGHSSCARDRRQLGIRPHQGRQ